MNLEKNPPNLESKLECVKLFFDSWGEPLPNQKQLMESIKNRWKKFLKNLANENKKSFGNERLDCCSMNKREYK